MIFILLCIQTIVLIFIVIKKCHMNLDKNRT